MDDRQTPVDLNVVARELSEHLNIGSIAETTIQGLNDDIRTVALQMDSLRELLGELDENLPAIEHASSALLAGADKLEALFKKIDRLEEFIDQVEGTVDHVTECVKDAEKAQPKQGLQPLDLVFDTLKLKNPIMWASHSSTAPRLPSDIYDTKVFFPQEQNMDNT